MTLYNTESPLSRQQRQNINATWDDILSRFSNLQRQINILAGDNDVDELIQRITDTVNNADATLTDLQAALNDATQLIDDMITATTSATDAANAANQATADATQLISDMTALQSDLEQLQTSLEQSITDATQATTDAINATTNANQAIQDAQQATTDAVDAAQRAESVADAIEGWGQVVPYQSGAIYQRNNPVTYQGSTYQSLVDDNDSLPTDDTKWIVIARRGLDGQGAVQTVNEQLPDPNGNVDVGIANINGLQGALDAKASDTDLIALDNKVTTHLDNDANPHNVTKAQVGLGNVDNVKQATKLDFDAHVLAKTTDTIRPHGMGRIAGQDYEEGTFTPVIYGLTTTGTHTYNLQNGIYRKIGRSVFIAIQVRMSSKDTNMAGGVAIGGLPFVANFDASLSIGRFDFITLDSDVNSLGALVRPTSSRIEINQLKNNNAISFLDSSKTTDGTLFVLAGVYSI